MKEQGAHSGRRLGLWLTETLAIIFSAACLGALAVLLALTDNQTIFNYHGVTLNTIVSILVTGSKVAALMVLGETLSQWKWILFTDERRPLIDFERIDLASRGPAGSLQLLWNCKGGNLLRLGAITIILCLAVDPFAQQLVQYRTELVFTDSPRATVARAERYSKGNQVNTALMLDPSLDPPSPNARADADFSMQSAILYGLTQTLNNTIQQLPFQCPTGNCTWPAYDSLAICSRCTDLTSSLEQASDYGAQYVPLMEDNNAAAISNGTAYRLPNGLFIDNIDGWAWGAEPMYGAMFMATFGTGNASKTNSMADLSDTLIWAAGVLKTGANPANASAEWPDLPVAATECALYYCVNRYASSVHNGTLHEAVTADVAGGKRAADSWALVDFPDAWEPYNETMAQSIDFDDNFSAAKRSDLAIETPDGQRFNVSQTAVDSISAYFKSTFQEDLMVYNETNNTVDGQINGWYMNSTTIQYKPSAIQPFYTSADLNTTFKTLATSMTNALRGDADAEGSEMVGQTGQMTTYYHVQWPWIALHCVIVLMSALFLIFTIRESSVPDGAAPVWKSSTLAAMSRGTHVTHVLDGAVTLGDMQKMAQEEKVVLFAKGGEVMKDGSNVISSGVRSTDQL